MVTDSIRSRIGELHKAGIHLVGIKDLETKDPMPPGWKQPWNLRGEPAELGWVPGRSDVLTIDLDPRPGTPPLEALQKRTRAVLGEPDAKYPSLGKGGEHWLYALRNVPGETEPLGSPKLKVGDTRCDLGYIVLWGDAGKDAALKVAGMDREGKPSRREMLEKLKPLMSQKAARAAANWAKREQDKAALLVSYVAEFKRLQTGRHDALLSMTLKLVRGGLDPEEVRKEFRAAKPADREQNAWLGEVDRAVDGAKELADNVVENNPAGLERALRKLEIEARYEIRHRQVQVRGRQLAVTASTHGVVVGHDGWMLLDSVMAAFVRDLLGRSFIWMKPVRGGGVVPVPFRLSPDRFDEFLLAILHSARTDGFREWLETAPPWDGKPRLDSVLTDLFYVDPPSGNGFTQEEQELLAWASRAVPMTAAARCYEPGLKVDQVPVLIGPQGTGKSTWARSWLPPTGQTEWFSDAIDFAGRPKEQLEAIKGRVIVEFSEMVGLKRADLGKVKAFITRLDDGAIRLAYRRNPDASPRMVAFALTTNTDTALPNDETGNRRFVAVRLDPEEEKAKVCVEEYFEERRAQLWAEAVHRVKAGESPALPRHLAQAQAEANERHRHADSPVEDAIRQAFPKGVMFPGLSLEEIAVLTRLSLDKVVVDRDGQEHEVYKPWSQVHQRESGRLRTALGNNGWQQTPTKRRLDGDFPRFRWHSLNADAADPVPYSREARSRVAA